MRLQKNYAKFSLSGSSENSELPACCQHIENFRDCCRKVLELYFPMSYSLKYLENMRYRLPLFLICIIAQF